MIEAAALGLRVVARLHPEEGGTLLLLGPDEPKFWAIFSASAEAADGLPDPMDRWSERVIGALAAKLGAEARFPFGGPPWPPFIGWALQSGQVWSSPLGLLVDGHAGLFVSFRGALAFAERLDLPPASRRPCNTCAAQPCRTACPVNAFASGSYDVAACHGFLDTEAGADCLHNGCAARRACPVGAGLRLAEQSAFHMAAFHPRDTR